MNKKYDELIKYVKQTEALSHASGLIAWDQETMMPKGSVLQRADCLASLESEIHKRKSNKIISDLLGEVNTTDATETICDATTPYPFADCSGTGCGDSWEYTYVNNEDGATILYTFSNGGDSSVLSVTVTGQTETGYDNLIITDGAGAELYNASGDHTGQVVTSGDGVINIAISSDTSYAPGSDGNGNGTTMTFDATCEAAQNAAVIALLESGSWRVDAETAGHMGVGPDFQFYAEWWNGLSHASRWMMWHKQTNTISFYN